MLWARMSALRVISECSTLVVIIELIDVFLRVFYGICPVTDLLTKW
jgi:hypothetical protein